MHNGVTHGRRKVHDYFLLLLCKSSIWFTEQHIFKIIIYFFNTSKCAANYVISFEVYDGFIARSKDFEAMKTGKLAIRPWLSCPYNEITLVDLQSSVVAALQNAQKLHNTKCPNGDNYYSRKKILPLHLLKASRLLIIDAKCFNFCLATSFCFLPSAKSVLSKLIIKLLFT